MKFINWLKNKLTNQNLEKQADLQSLISFTVIEPLPKHHAPIIESEILAEYPTRPDSSCFPELAEMLDDHRAWLKKVEQIMRENKSCDYNPAAVGTELMSAIGTWLHNEGKALAQFPEYTDLLNAHTQLNRCAGAILVQHQRGEFLHAVNMLRCDFMQNSALVEQSLSALLVRARQDCCPECTAHNDELLSVAA